MSRATRFAAVASALTALYVLIWLSVVPVPLLAPEVKDDLLPVIPWFLLVSFGSYSLYSLGWGLFSFRDTPDAYEELMGEIALAKNDLRAKGVTVD